MGLVGRILKPPIYASAAGIAVFSFWTRKSNVEPLPLTDLLFESSFYHRYNPERNQMVRDTCVRFVPLRHIDPLLLENGRLVEAFSAGFWGGPGTRAHLVKAVDPVVPMLITEIQGMPSKPQSCRSCSNALTRHISYGPETIYSTPLMMLVSRSPTISKSWRRHLEVSCFEEETPHPTVASVQQMVSSS